MEYKIYKETDFNKSNWTGGTTTQLAIFPQESRYLERNFIWRLSSATCDLEETTFSKLADYDRVLMVLSGNAVLAHQDVRVARLQPFEQDRFDGAYTTKSFGKITDYNLMVKKGNEGFLDVIMAEEQSKPLDRDSYPSFERYTTALYCTEGFAAVTVCGETLMLTVGQQLVINDENRNPAEVSVMGDGTLIRAQIFYDYHPEEMAATVIPRERVSFDDFKTCIYLSNVQFRGAKYIIKSLKNQWFDEELSKAIRKLEQFYIPFIITTLGFCAILGIGYNRFDTVLQWVLALVGWFLADILLVSPLLYLMVVPKPARKHIKDVANLTPYEKRVRERELSTNERMDKLMKRYKTAGMQRYDKNGNAYMIEKDD
ncbi:HutD family protein [Emergencia sp. JLR.KK010]|uniref:HutD/Ves family protein n=1 Tax=Emergencia sp. JLR.KK010 TaxID=3114296 RepID=UPI0030CAE391